MSKTTQRIQARLRIEQLLRISKAFNNYRFEMVQASDRYTTGHQRKILRESKNAASLAIRELIEIERNISASLNQEDLF